MLGVGISPKGWWLFIGCFIAYFKGGISPMRVGCFEEVHVLVGATFEKFTNLRRLR